MSRFVALIALSLAVCIGSGSARAQEQPPATEAEAQAVQQQIDEMNLAELEQQIDEMKQRLAELEKKTAAAENKQQLVEAAAKDTKIKIDGRLFAGAFKTGKEGSFSNRSLDIPDAKLRLTLSPSKDVTIVNRFSNNRAGSNGFDYFYLDLKDWGGGAPGHTLRVGKFKIDVGQETWSDNPVESILITNAVSHISGYDEGINLRGPLDSGPLPATYSVALMNGNKGVTASDSGLAWSAKLGLPATPQMYFSASYLRTGNLVKSDGTLDQSDFNIAEVVDGPAGATGWKRSLWEVDARYGCGKEGIKSVVGAAPDTPWQLGATYGRFTDDATGVADRKGDYWFVEGLHNLTPRTYLASRYSDISLDNGALAKLGGSPVAVNRYHRFAIGAGYRLTPMTHVKAEYTRNDTSGGASEPDLDQLAVGVATKF